MVSKEDFEESVLPHMKAAFNLAYWIVRSREEAEDVVQDAFVRAFRAFSRFNGAAPNAWLLTIMRNVAYRALHSRNRAGNVVLLSEDLKSRESEGVREIPSPEWSAETLLVAESESQQLLAALDELPVNYREVVVLRELEGLSYSEIAHTIDAPVGTMMSRLSRGRAELRNALARRIARDETDAGSDAHEVLNALLDGADAGMRHPEAAAHVASCPQCAALANEYRRIGAGLRAVAYVDPPADIEEKIRARLAAESPPTRGGWQLDARRWLQQAAALIVVAGLSALVSWQLTRSAVDRGRLERDVLAAHVRSLLQDSTIQIASSERHVVRPWFNGRVEFAPGVKDLAAQNFALLGGRVDWVDGRRVATLVYKRRLHIINVFLWPADGQADQASHAMGWKGYNAITWTTGGMTHWAVSDLNAKELAELQTLL